MGQSGVVPLKNNKTEISAEIANEEAFKQAVRETSEIPVIFLDPDEIQGDHFNERVRKLENHLNEQNPGAVDALVNALVEEYGPIFSREDVLGMALEDADMSGPRAKRGIIIDGVEHAIVQIPKNDADTKAEIVRSVISSHGSYSDEELDKIVKNAPGSDEDYNKNIGYHEGGHLHKDSGRGGRTLNREVYADQVSREKLINDGNEDVADMQADMRHLSYADFSHATGPLIESEDAPSVVHTNTARTYKADIDTHIDKNFDWDKYEGSATNSKELLKENPDIYFDAMDDKISDVQNKAMDDYNANPDALSAKRGAVEAQVFTDYSKNFEGAYRRRVMGEDVPKHENTQLIPQDVENSVYKDVDPDNVRIITDAKLKEPEKTAIPEQPKNEPKDVPNPPPEGKPEEEPPEDDKGYQNGVDGTAYTTEVSGLEKGDPNVDFNKGVTVGGQPIENIFSQTANPDPEAVSLVNAKVDTQTMGVAILDNPKIEIELPQITKI